MAVAVDRAMNVMSMLSPLQGLYNADSCIVQLNHIPFGVCHKTEGLQKVCTNRCRDGL